MLGHKRKGLIFYFYVSVAYPHLDSGFWKAAVWLMDIVYKTKADIPALSHQ